MSTRQKLSVEQIQQAITSGTITESVVLDLWAAYEAAMRELEFVKQELSIARFRAKTAEAMVNSYVAGEQQ